MLLCLHCWQLIEGSSSARETLACGMSSCGIVWHRHLIAWHRHRVASHRLASSASGVASSSHRIADLCWRIASIRLDAENACHRIASHRQAALSHPIASPRRILNLCNPQNRKSQTQNPEPKVQNPKLKNDWCGHFTLLPHSLDLCCLLSLTTS